ncbi:Scr1 family TA system antitoxin-like transcriptional regulator [Streptomyces sp. NPDC017056]|uniref:DUF397 domain-containing protein n=1 Tax=Streptomyces sp. NPDC017056 TaxID=3364973 RepID=UPI0037A0A33B
MTGGRSKGWWDEYRGKIPPDFLDVAEFEHHATSLRTLQTVHIPGLFQTEDHARALFDLFIFFRPTDPPWQLSAPSGRGRTGGVEFEEVAGPHPRYHQADLRGIALAQVQWLKSSFSESSGNACIEITIMDTAVALRECDDITRTITPGPHAFRDLLVRIKANLVGDTRH